MLALLFCCGVLFLVAIGAAQEIPAPEQLMTAAHKVSGISQAGPYVFSATVVINPGDKKNEKAGRLTISRDHDRARVELEIGGLRETRVFLGDKQYAMPGQGFLFATGLNTFDQSWDPVQAKRFHFAPTYTFGHVSRQRDHGVDVWCFDRIQAQGKDKLCFDPARSVLLTENSRDQGRREFWDYTTFGEQMYPQRVQIVPMRIVPIEVNHIAINPAELKDEVFAVPEKSIELETCDDIRPPRSDYTPEPEYSEKARRKEENAVTLLDIFVTKEGKVSAVQVMNPDPDGLGDNAREKIKTWRFKPATCGNRPVNAEMIIEVSFNIF